MPEKSEGIQTGIRRRPMLKTLHPEIHSSGAFQVEWKRRRFAPEAGVGGVEGDAEAEASPRHNSDRGVNDDMINCTGNLDFPGA